MSSSNYVIISSVICLVLLIISVAGYFIYNSSIVITPTATTSTTVPATTPPVTQVVNSNNGTVSCSTYCGGTQKGPWNNELPVAWNGASCVSTSKSNVGCNDTPITIDPAITLISCTCTPNNKGWN